MLSFYTSQSTYSDPGKWAPQQYENLPDSVEELVGVVQNIIIHQFWIHDSQNYGITPKMLIESGRRPNEEINLLTVEQILDKYFELNDAGLDIARSASDHVVGNCRDFTLMLVSFLRHKGIPARSRSGVAKYFTPNRYEDHFLCEYYDEIEARWTRVDAQLDQLMIKKCGISFNTLDVPHDAFFDAAESMDQVDVDGPPERYGIDAYTGERYLNYKLFSDYAHLNKMEILPWEGWGIGFRAASENLENGDLETLKNVKRAIKCNDIKAISKSFEANKDFMQPSDYIPFFMELPFFKC